MHFQNLHPSVESHDFEFSELLHSIFSLYPGLKQGASDLSTCCPRNPTTILHMLAVVTLTVLCAASALGTATPFESRDRLSSYKNPIISGFAPDPSCIRVHEQFFCVTSSFSAFPGIPVYTSRDLVQWKQIGEVYVSYQ